MMTPSSRKEGGAVVAKRAKRSFAFAVEPRTNLRKYFAGRAVSRRAQDHHQIVENEAEQENLRVQVRQHGAQAGKAAQRVQNQTDPNIGENGAAGERKEHANTHRSRADKARSNKARPVPPQRPRSVRPRSVQRRSTSFSHSFSFSHPFFGTGRP